MRIFSLTRLLPSFELSHQKKKHVKHHSISYEPRRIIFLLHRLDRWKIKTLEIVRHRLISLVVKPEKMARNLPSHLCSLNIVGTKKSLKLPIKMKSAFKYYGGSFNVILTQSRHYHFSTEN